MTFDIVTYKGKDHLVATIPNFFSDYLDFVTIGAESLNEALYNDDFGYSDDEARKIDEYIYAYVDDEYFNLKDEAFIEKVISILD